jgi:uracil-DNA glycosylase
MLNVNLSVKKNEANSHQKKGWEEFTDAVVKCLAKREGLVYLLWGKPASVKCKSINNMRNSIIASSHPSPLGAYKTNHPFMKSKCFSRCNEALIEMGKEPIDWNIK